jgi:hypothetical protein
MLLNMERYLVPTGRVGDDTVVAVGAPYRDPPQTSTPERCEICGIKTRSDRCANCLAVAQVLPKLEVPVVLVCWSWYLGWRFAGVGLVLVDRWRKIARCSCQFPFVSERSVSAIARARATRWAPTSRIASSLAEINEALAESIRRTPADQQWAIPQRFESAMHRACHNASCARDGYLSGSRVWPSHAWPLQPPA